MLISETINDALIEIAVINANDEASPQEASHALRTLNRIIDLYNTQNLYITYLEEIVYSRPNSGWGNSITIGINQQFDEVAPIHIESGFVRDGGNTDYILTPMTHNQFASITYKDTVAIPKRYYVQKTSGNGLKIYFDTIPQEDDTIHFFAKRPYVGSDVNGKEYVPTDNIEWDYGFEKMLMTRLAVELSSSFEVTPSSALISRAQEAENLVKAKNYQPILLGRDKSLMRRSGSIYGRAGRGRL